MPTKRGSMVVTHIPTELLWPVSVVLRSKPNAFMVQCNGVHACPDRKNLIQAANIRDAVHTSWMLRKVFSSSAFCGREGPGLNASV